MCGRYTLAANAVELVEMFDAPAPTFAWTPRFNIAPSQRAPVVAADRHGRRMGLMTWGLVPAWADEPMRTATPMEPANARRRAERITRGGPEGEVLGGVERDEQEGIPILGATIAANQRPERAPFGPASLAAHSGPHRLAAPSPYPTRDGDQVGVGPY
ncbi:MAG: SOS response-associated peptidase [Gemmatimonadetes bacterium]|nr:SOS response-associated peptidase [Gemmatimonadota bacterium]